MNSLNDSSSQGGYDWLNGMSNRAVAAYDSGMMPASKIATALRRRGYRVTGAWVAANFTASEWHHTSKKFNATNFYSLERIEAELDRNPSHYDALAVEFLATAKAAKREGSYLADVTITSFERIVLNRFGKLGGWRPIFRTLRGVLVKPVSTSFVEVAGEGRLKLGNKLAIVRLEAAELKRRKNLASAAKRKATIAAKKTQAEAGRAMQAALVAHVARPLALPAPTKKAEPIHNRGVDFIRAELGRGYQFAAAQRAVVREIAIEVANKRITFDAAVEQVRTFAISSR